MLRPSRSNSTTAITFNTSFAITSIRDHVLLPKKPATMQTRIAFETRLQRCRSPQPVDVTQRFTTKNTNPAQATPPAIGIQSGRFGCGANTRTISPYHTNPKARVPNPTSHGDAAFLEALTPSAAVVRIACAITASSAIASAPTTTVSNGGTYLAT